MPFSQPHADLALNFFEHVLKHTADDWYGKPFILAPWEEEAISHIYGDLDDNGNRVIEMVYLELGKKSGKSELCAGLALLEMCLNSQPGCQIYGAASVTRQTLHVYRAACKMVEQSPILMDTVRLLRSTNRIVKRSDQDSFYAAVPADGDFGDGVNPALTIADEVHRWKTRKQMENWDVLANGGITRKRTLTVAITTAGVQAESPLAWRLHEKTRKINEGSIQDPRFWGRIYSADKTDPIDDPKTWIKALPSLKENGGFLDIAKIREKYVEHESEGNLTAFRRYFLCMWDEKENRAIDMNRWADCGVESEKNGYVAAGLLPTPITSSTCSDAVSTTPTTYSALRIARDLPDHIMKHFEGRECWIGADLSMAIDLSAVVCIFQCPNLVDDEDEDFPYEVLPFFYTPEAKVGKREKKDGMPYRRWADEGFIELVPGEVIQPAQIKARIDWADKHFDIQKICFDPYNSREVSTALIADGCAGKVDEIKQNLTSLSDPTKKLLKLIVQRKLFHGNHPVLRWNASCCSAREENDLMMFEKPQRERTFSRIDGIAATVDALARAMMHVPQTFSMPVLL